MVISKWARTLLHFSCSLSGKWFIHPYKVDHSEGVRIFCRYHLDWISLRHSVLTKSTVLRLALASMRSGQPEAGHPRNFLQGRSIGPSGEQLASPSNGLTAWRVARPVGAAPGSRPRSVPTRWNQARGSAGGLAACLKCWGGMHGFIQIEKVSHISPRGRDDLPMRFGKCKGGRLSRKQFLKAHLILIQSAEPLLGYRNAACTCTCAEVPQPRHVESS